MADGTEKSVQIIKVDTPCDIEVEASTTFDNQLFKKILQQFSGLISDLFFPGLYDEIF